METTIYNDIIHVAFCITDNDGTYIRHVATTMASILSNTKSKVHFHLIHDSTLTSENQRYLSNWIESQKQCLSYYLLTDTQLREIELLLKQNGYSCSAGTLYRLKITEILPDVHRVIYLDSDIVVNLDLNLIWEISIDSFFCGAILDNKSTRYKWSNRKSFKQMQIDYRKYFNAGVMILNLDLIKKEIMLWEQASAFFGKYKKKVIFFDQDALNNLLQKKTKLLDERFNFIPIGESEICKRIPAIIHFAGPKPWNYRCSPYDWLYWKYFSMTPWGDSVEKLLSAQQLVGIDLGYALQSGRIASRKNLLKGIWKICQLGRTR